MIKAKDVMSIQEECGERENTAAGSYIKEGFSMKGIHLIEVA